MNLVDSDQQNYKVHAFCAVNVHLRGEIAYFVQHVLKKSHTIARLLLLSKERIMALFELVNKYQKYFLKIGYL